MTTTVVVDPLLVADTREWVTSRIDPERLREAPIFSVAEVAKIFYGRSPSWIRWLEGNEDEIGEGDPNRKVRPNRFVLDGQPIEFPRLDKGKKAGQRYFDLALIERMSHALAQNGAINGRQLIHAIVMIKTLAQIYEHI